MPAAMAAAAGAQLGYDQTVGVDSLDPDRSIWASRSSTSRPTVGLPSRPPRSLAGARGPPRPGVQPAGAPAGDGAVTGVRGYGWRHRDQPGRRRHLDEPQRGHRDQPLPRHRHRSRQRVHVRWHAGHRVPLSPTGLPRRGLAHDRGRRRRAGRGRSRRPAPSLRLHGRLVPDHGQRRRLVERDGERPAARRLPRSWTPAAGPTCTRARATRSTRAPTVPPTSRRSGRSRGSSAPSPSPARPEQGLGGAGPVVGGHDRHLPRRHQLDRPGLRDQRKPGSRHLRCRPRRRGPRRRGADLARRGRGRDEGPGLITLVRWSPRPSTGAASRSSWA
jgi:hypothetical protein